jgi:hypothetical protein
MKEGQSRRETERTQKREKDRQIETKDQRKGGVTMEVPVLACCSRYLLVMAREATARSMHGYRCPSVGGGTCSRALEAPLYMQGTRTFRVPLDAPGGPGLAMALRGPA